MSQIQQTANNSAAAVALANSILAPRAGEASPYLMPVATASHCAAFDAFDNGLYLTYPRRVIYVDFDNGNDANDGSQEAPLKTLDRVFSDNLLACVCQHMGQDRIPVCCKGTQTLEYDEKLTTNIDGAFQNLFDYTMYAGTSDYCRHLEIMPWAHEARPVFKFKFAATMPEIENASAALLARLTIAKNAPGIYWNKCDFVFEIDVTYSFDKQYLQLDTELYGFDKCEALAAIDCNMSVIVNRYNARLISNFIPGTSSEGTTSPQEPEEKEKETTRDSASWSGGSSSSPEYHKGGSHRGAWGAGGTTRPASNPQHEHADAPDFCYLGVMHYRQCNNAFVAGGRASWQAEAKSNYTARIYSAAFEHCENLHARNYTFDVLSVANASGTGEAWTNADGSHGISNYTLEPTATTRIAAGCSNAILHNVTGNITAKATATANNTPYTTTADGVTTYHTVGGKSTATAIAYATSDKIDDADAPAVSANASHPSGNISETKAQKG